MKKLPDWLNPLVSLENPVQYEQIERDHAAAIIDLHRAGYSVDQIRMTMISQGYFGGKSNPSVISFIQQRIAEFEAAPKLERKKPQAAHDDLVERMMRLASHTKKKTGGNL